MQKMHESQRWTSIWLMHRYFWPVCFALFLGLRLLPIVLLPPVMDADSLWYYSRAAGIAAGEGYSQGGHFTAYWPVGYPGFLGFLFFLFGKNPLSGQIANLLISTLTLLMLIPLSRSAFGCEKIVRLGAVLWAIYPNHVFYNALLMSEILFTGLLVLGLYLFVNNKSAVWSGLAFGLALLTKSQALFIPAIILVLYGVRARPGWKAWLRKSAFLYVAMLLVVLPWTIRNYQRLGVPALVSTNGGTNLYVGNNPFATGNFYDPTGHEPRVNPASGRELEASAFGKREAIAWIKSDPLAFLSLLPRKVFHLWYLDGEAEWSYQGGYPAYEEQKVWFRSVRIFNQLYYFTILGLTGYALFANRRRMASSPLTFGFGYGLALYLTMISMAFFGTSRFHFPVMPFFCMYAASAIITILPSSDRARDQ